MTTTEAHNPFTCLDVACAPCHGLQEETMDTRPNPDADDIVAAALADIRARRDRLDRGDPDLPVQGELTDDDVEDADAILAALREAGFTVQPPAPRADPEALRAIIDAALADKEGWRDEGPTEAVYPGRKVDDWWHARLTLAVAWECPSCREDVGWRDHIWLYLRDGAVRVHSDCGHCGADLTWDAEGNDLD